MYLLLSAKDDIEEFSTRTYSCQCEPGQDSSLWHENLELTTICPTLENYDSEISTPVRPPGSWTNWSIGAKLESSGRHKESYVCVPPNVKSIYAALMMYSRNQGSITNLTKQYLSILLTPSRVVGSNTSAKTLIQFSVFQVRSKIARGACDQPKAGCMGPVVSYNPIPIGHFHLTSSYHWIILESLTPVDSWLSTNTGTH